MAAGGVLSSVPQLTQRRILGEVPLADDGSFNVEVPANLPIQLQLLDEKGPDHSKCFKIAAQVGAPAPTFEAFLERYR